MKKSPEDLVLIPRLVVYVIWAMSRRQALTAFWVLWTLTICVTALTR